MSIKRKIENLTDGEFIDTLDRITQLVYGLSATDYILYEYENNEEVKKMLSEELK